MSAKDSVGCLVTSVSFDWVTARQGRTILAQYHEISSGYVPGTDIWGISHVQPQLMPYLHTDEVESKL